MNSELLFNNAGGISVRGDTATGAVPSAAVPFVRLVNNTIIGGTVASVTSFVPTILAAKFSTSVTWHLQMS